MKNLLITVASVVAVIVVIAFIMTFITGTGFADLWDMMVDFIKAKLMN